MVGALSMGPELLREPQEEALSIQHSAFSQIESVFRGHDDFA
jgi:hypothetical protein